MEDVNKFWDRTLINKFDSIADEMIDEGWNIESKYRGLLKKAIQYHTIFNMELREWSIYMKYKELKEDYEDEFAIPI